MERIKQAIERARETQARTGAAPGTAANGAAGPSADRGKRRLAPLSAGDKAAARAATEGTPALIRYEQTKVVEVDPKRLEANRIIALKKHDSRTVSIDRLRTQVQQAMHENGWRTLAVTSPGAGCGKTTIALNLGISVAQQTEQTALLVDLDLRQPQVAEYLGIEKGNSLVDYLRGDVPLSSVFVNPSIPRLTLLPNHRPVINAAELLMTSEMKAVVGDIRDRYASRLVVFDLPPLLTTDDALAFLPQIDCVLLVVENGVTKRSELRDAYRLLGDVPVVGSVLNKAQ